jgi:Ran GTPase-activating protein (RanGAP) involved in mRNA processing and transport
MVSNNNFLDEGLDFFSEMIDRNSSLEHLDLSKNTLSDLGILPFSRSLASNRSLVTINLRHNQIGKEGGIALREAVSGHKYLVRVFLEDNAIQIRDIEDIDRMCLKNREERAKRRMPQFEQELGLLAKGHKRSEV